MIDSAALPGAKCVTVPPPLRLMTCSCCWLMILVRPKSASWGAQRGVGEFVAGGVAPVANGVSFPLEMGVVQ